MPAPTIKVFFDPPTWTFSYVVYESANSPCIIIDSVMNYDHKSGRTSLAGADAIIDFIQQEGLTCEWILETHAHADHMTAAYYLREKLGGKLAIGSHVTSIQKVFKTIFHLDSIFQADGSQFDYLIQPEETICFGRLSCKALSVPGHTPACMAYQIGNVIFVGDTLFLPDVGTARCDFPGGNAAQLYDSIQKILSFPEGTQLFMCHDYPPSHREVQHVTTVKDQKEKNIHVHDGISKEAFIKMRIDRDKTLEMPLLILPAIQINIRAGAFPPPEENGTAYLKIPLNSL